MMHLVADKSTVVACCNSLYKPLINDKKCLIRTVTLIAKSLKHP